MLCLGKSCSIWLSLWLNLVWLCTSEHCLTCAPVFPLGLNKVIKKNLATLKASRATCEGNILVLQSECGFVWSHGQGHRLLRQTNQIQTLFTFYRLQDFGQVAFFTFLQYIMEAVVTLVTSLELTTWICYGSPECWVEEDLRTWLEAMSREGSRMTAILDLHGSDPYAVISQDSSCILHWQKS